MSMFSSHDVPLSRTRVLVALFATLFALTGAVLLAGPGSTPAGAAKTPATLVLGGADEMPDPLCPLNCQVIPSVSGIQTALPSGQAPYRVPADGKITAWKIFLGKPTKADRSALNKRFGSPPRAAIAVLQKIKTPEGRIKFRLQRKSPVEGLSRFLGGVATFRLDKPLIARKGQFVALSVATWAPAFAAGLPAGEYSWRASRQPGMCGAGSVDMAAPQLKVGSKRFYSCKFTGSRLLFTAKLKFD
jgi:hypothetical protein